MTSLAPARPLQTAEQRSAALRELLCCCIRACASRGPPAQRTPEEAAELEPLLGALAAYRAYPQVGWVLSVGTRVGYGRQWRPLAAPTIGGWVVRSMVCAPQL